ncbi:hypothetical protein SAZ10_00525 [Mesorhizobium sp. BAC0120]|uniref:hypothetical protein n=1 Tax=Mesorhizobium sp. BAC0120 TaxID=3090670 RepID=UPI00298D2E6A|nr:hypothetical protein [Mesorhizobium sp. BAC0120]MDW6020240.1 hypothetical protein [Mesorhizobium sp. BAC0120]
MFHTYICASSGNVVDFDRASFLMDRDLLNEAMQTLMCEGVSGREDLDRDTFKPTVGAHEVPNRPPTVDSRAQLVWNRYCKLHAEKYGSSFTPDDDPHWDSS